MCMQTRKVLWAGPRSVSVCENGCGFSNADFTKEYSILRVNNLKEREWLKDREKGRDAGRERKSVLKIGR